jgi:dynein assembly factor 3
LQDSQQHPLQPQQQAQQQQTTSETQQEQLQQQQKRPQQLHLYVYESEPEVLARHMLLLALLFDAAQPVRTRAELFLELHGNAVLRQKSADYLGA